MKISDETKVGIMAAFGLAILIMGYSFLKGNNIFKKSFTVYAVYDKIDGLNQSDLVRLNGLAIGRVSKLSILKPGSNKIVAEIHLKDGVLIAKNSVARIESFDLLGTKMVAIYFDTLGEQAKDGDTLRAEVQLGLAESVSREILPVKKKAEQMMGSIDSVVQVIQALLKGGQVEGSLNNLYKASGGFASVAANVDTMIITERKTIKSIMDNIDGITGNLNKNNDQITNVIHNLSSVSDSLSKVSIASTVKSLDSTLAQLHGVLKKVNDGEGTAGKLINDPVLYNNLSKASASLDSLLIDLKTHPDRYVHLSVFGKKSDANPPKNNK